MKKHGWFIALLAWMALGASAHFWLTSHDRHGPAWSVWLSAAIIGFPSAGGAVYGVLRAVRTRRNRVP